MTSPLLLYTLAWERHPPLLKPPNNQVNIHVTTVQPDGSYHEFTKIYDEWLGVATSNMPRVLQHLNSLFPGCRTRYTLLDSQQQYRKVLPYFHDRLTNGGRFHYAPKPFYKLYVDAPVNDVGLALHLLKVAYFEEKDWLVRLYLDFGGTFYHRWFHFHPDAPHLLDALLPADAPSLPSPLLFAAFDLETVSLTNPHRLPEGNHPDDRIVMISLILWSEGTHPHSHLFYLNPTPDPLGFTAQQLLDSLSHSIPNSTPDLIHLHEFDDELQLLHAFHQFLDTAHILTGYNIENFDLPCLIHRLAYLDPQLLFPLYTSYRLGQDRIVITLRRKLVLDLYLFIQNFSNQNLSSLKLDDVAAHKLGIGKVPIATQSIHYWYAEACRSLVPNLIHSLDRTACRQTLGASDKLQTFGTFRECLAYCLQDSLLVQRLFELEKVFPFLEERANFAGLDSERALYMGNAPYILDLLKTYGTRLGFFFNAHFLRQDDLTPLKKLFVEKDRFQGGMNHSDSQSFHRNVAVLDFASMYPSIIVNQNICFGTATILTDDVWAELPAAVRERCHTERYRRHDEEDFIQESEPSNLQIVWNTEQQPGFLPALCSHFLEHRAQSKADFQRTGQLVYHTRQWNIKIALNSIYGCLGSLKCKVGCVSLGMAIAFFGRHYLLQSFRYLRGRGYAVPYCDTDSLFVVGYEGTGEDVVQHLGQPHIKLQHEQTLLELLVLCPKRYCYRAKDGRLHTRGFQKKKNALLARMTDRLVEATFEALAAGGEPDEAEGWALWVDTLRDAFVESSLRKFYITRKTRMLHEYKANCHAPHLMFLRKHPELAGDFIDYAFCEADVSLKASKQMIVQEYDRVNFGSLFRHQQAMFVQLLHVGFFRHWPPGSVSLGCDQVLQVMKWQNLMRTELRWFGKTGGQRVCLLVEKGVPYTFKISC